MLGNMWYKNFPMRVLVVTAFLCWHPSVMANGVKSVMVDARIMKFPLIALDGVSYDSLAFEYSIRNDLEIIEAAPSQQTIDCPTGPKKGTLWSVDYRGPELIFRITDLRKQKRLFQQVVDTKGSYEDTHFYTAHGPLSVSDPKHFCNSVSVPASTRDEARWAIEIKKQVVQSALKRMDDFLQNDAFLQYEDLRFPLYYAVGQSSRYEEFNRAFDYARSAFDLSVQFGLTQEAEDSLGLAAAIWEKELQTIHKEKQTPSVARMKRALHRNLIPVYLYLKRFDAAMRHDAMAMFHGMDPKQSMQTQILDYERRVILSPKVAKDVVLTANLYRLGQSASREARWIEVDGAESFAQSLVYDETAPH